MVQQRISPEFTMSGHAMVRTPTRRPRCSQRPRRPVSILVRHLALGCAAAGLVGCGGSGGSGQQGGGSDAQSAATARALRLIVASPRSFAASVHDRFVRRDVIVDADGREHVRFDRVHKGLRVIGGDVVVHGDGAGGLLGVSLTLRRVLDLPIQAAVTQQEAVTVAEAEFAGARDARTTVERVVYARGETIALAYEVVLYGTRPDQTPSELHVIVDAQSATVLDRWDAVETDSAGLGHGLFDGTVALTTNLMGSMYQLSDPSRGDQRTVDMNNGRLGRGALFSDADDIWGDGTQSNRQTVAVDAQYGMGETWDYYLLVHDRAGVANDGVGAFNRVHYGNAYDNAFWSDSCFCMTYGDGDGTTFYPFAELDVTGHEMTHGVTSRTANLTYSGESGGLNESTSDIFGTAVEFYAANPADPPDYDLGEKLYIQPGQALRYMYRPSKDGASADCWSAGVGDLDVHYSSGVGNHLFYLLAEGSGVGPYTDTIGATTCDGSTLSGIGRDAAEQIWYRALTVYMTSMTDYAGARAATLSAAADLYGGASAESAAVAAAWTAVNVN